MPSINLFYKVKIYTAAWFDSELFPYADMKIINLVRSIRLWRSLFPLILSVITCGLIIGFGSAIAQTVGTGWLFNSQSTLNQITLAGVQYTGECASAPIYPALSASFISAKTPPARFTRVIVKNITPGVSNDPYPYTDREYDERRPSSQSTRMEFGRKHKKKSFTIVAGKNTFEYAIKQRDRLLETGTFAATIDTTLRQEERHAAWQKNEVCANSSVALNVCADKRTQRAYQCPDGKILKSYLEPDDSKIFTRIYNETDTTIEFRLDGYRQRLSPGDYTEVTSSTYSYPKLKFNPNCARCDDLTETESLTPGKRYQFTSSGNKKTIGVEDYSRY